VLILLYTWPKTGLALLALNRIAYAIQDDYDSLGLAPPKSEDIYLSSVMGSAFRCLRQGTRLRVGGGGKLWFRNVAISTSENHNEFVITLDGETITRKWLVLTKPIKIQREFHILKRPPAEATKILLNQINAGTQSTKWMLHSCGYLVPDEQTDQIPVVSFILPSNTKELVEYQQWLIRMTGSLDRFCDGWNHEIKLTIEKRATTPLLVASSAGSDGKWNTKDDMVIKRDTKTGQIVEEIGFGVEK
jgi:hypothetical protein